jgi:ribosome-associated protein
MVKAKKLDEATVLAETAIKGIQEKKGHKIVSLDLRDVKGAISDYFIVCHGDSVKQVEAIAKSVEEEIYKTVGEDPWHREGLENCEWVLLDYINIVVHIFLKENRDFYGIEELWGDAETTHYE